MIEMKAIKRGRDTIHTHMEVANHATELGTPMVSDLAGLSFRGWEQDGIPDTFHSIDGHDVFAVPGRDGIRH
jgi:hypothetical protein